MRWTQCGRVLEVKARLVVAVDAHTQEKEKKDTLAVLSLSAVLGADVMRSDSVFCFLSFFLLHFILLADLK